ncbi:hypothetical protein B0H14DRAFT_3526683 [Mycena olivaceomarginata]|nr:hypothetical protein B0H14DRAFT_3526683 [Mycena olivaceomarginata]
MLRLDLATERRAELDAILGGAGRACVLEAEARNESESVRMTFSLPGGPTATHYLERVRDGATTAPAHLDDAPGPAFVFDTPLERGLLWGRYLGKGDTGGTNTKSEGPAQVRVVAKVALHAAETALLVHEAAMYARAARLQGGVLPEVVSLYISLALLHAHGVQHGDLRADNVVVSSDGLPSLIDLSHARAHACKGEGACAELRDGRVLFGLG